VTSPTVAPPDVELRTLRWRPFRLSMSARFQAASGVLDHRDGVLLQLEDTSGRTGTGEASPMTAIDGASVTDVLALLEAHRAALVSTHPPELGTAPGVPALRCALDVALRDLEAQAAGKPLAALFAEEPAPWVSVNAVIGGGPPNEVANYGLQALEAGYSVLKLKVGLASLDEDAERVAALRDACPEATIRLDANAAWSEDEALRAFDRLYPYRIELLEQPVARDDVEALARLRNRAPMRIAADEAVDTPELFERVLELRAADFVVLKPMFLGGVTPAIGLAERAAARGISAFATTTFDSSIGIAASLHLAAALPTDAAQGLGTGAHLGADVVDHTLTARAGRLALPSAPGLGVAPDDAALDAVATAPWTEVTVGA
jgi:o-succinylbenzoate synthase